MPQDNILEFRLFIAIYWALVESRQGVTAHPQSFTKKKGVVPHESTAVRIHEYYVDIIHTGPPPSEPVFCVKRHLREMPISFF